MLFRFMLFFLFVGGTAYAGQYLPSTSPNATVFELEQKPRIGQRAISSEVITFSEYPVKTYISDQYADKGIIFGGDNPFISNDASNTTSPVLSGSPQFLGAIEGRFVDPSTHEPTTVNRFEMDAGNFDELSSTRLQWFNSSGELIAQKLDEEYAIEHFVVEHDGIASWKIELSRNN